LLSTLKKNERIIDYFGWLGAFLILSMFAVNSLQLELTTFIYQLTNFMGAIFVALAAAIKRAWPAVFLNLSWAGIATTVIVMELL